MARRQYMCLLKDLNFRILAKSSAVSGKLFQILTTWLPIAFKHLYMTAYSLLINGSSGKWLLVTSEIHAAGLYKCININFFRHTRQARV